MFVDMVVYLNHLLGYCSSDELFIKYLIHSCSFIVIVVCLMIIMFDDMFIVIDYCSYSCLCRLIIIIHFDFNIDNYIFAYIMIGYLFTCVDNEKHENLLVYTILIRNSFQSLENIMLNDIVLFLSCFSIHVNLVI